MKKQSATKATEKKAVVKTEKKPCCAAKKTCAKKAAVKTVSFTLHAEKGKNVFIAGQFNDWDPSARKLAYKAKEGYYSVSLKLAPGRYEYKFVVDGVWCADPQNVDSVQNDQGTFNSVITVK